MSKLSVTFVLLFLLATQPSAAVVSANERPLVDAGLDQRVRKGSVVLLDGTGTRDPDGTIEEYEWSVETPSGSVRSPADPHAARTRFRPTEVGRYAVTLTATDEDGATSSDTLYVTVSPGRGPSVDLSGPRSRETGDEGRYTARIDAGDADLDRIVWTVDGTTVADRSLSGRRTTDQLARVFPAEGTSRIRVTVYDVDGQRDSSSLSVSVERPSPSPSGSTGTTDVASTVAPTVSGPRLVTGARPLTGGYSLRVPGARDRIASVSWRTRSATVGQGFGTTIDWSPGTHRLFALVTYEDGSSDVARFADGGMDVRADPKPAIEIGELDRFGGISGAPVATDGYGNLRSLRVMVDGDVVAEATSDPSGGQLDDRKLARPFDYTDVEADRAHEVVVVATDTRGQTTTETTMVRPIGEPEIVRSEFVNGPVDSYHRRIDASRYAAHHVLEIDLNGADPENVVIEYTPRSPNLNQLHTDGYHQTRTVANGVLTVESYWAGYSPKDYLLKSGMRTILQGARDGTTSTSFDWFTVSASDPELRYEVIDDGTVNRKTAWGIIVDASRSFDPDHTNLKYRWKGGANPVSKDNATAKFDSWLRANLKITDGNNGITTNRYNFLNFYNPGIGRIRPTTERAYKPNETVRFKVVTNNYKLTKNRYDISLGLAVENVDYDLTNWGVTKVGEDCEIGKCDVPTSMPWMIDIDNRRFSFFHGTIEIEASELADGTAQPNVVLFNTGSPERTRITKRLPDVTVLMKGDRFWENVSVSDIEYTVEKPIVRSVTTVDEATRDKYLRDGYSIEETEAATRYTLEKRVQTQKKKYETRTRSFRQPQFRTIFLESHPAWSPSGRYSTTNTWTTTETEWHNSRGGKGRFTGRTRRHRIDRADYRTLKQFEYDYQVEKTGTRTVWRTKRIRVRKTGTRTETKCYRHFGCYPITETYSYWDTETYRIRSTDTYTYTVTKTGRYWSYGRRVSDHRFTGRTRRVQVDDADYTTQYEYRYRVEHRRRVPHYEVSRRVRTQKAKYEWVVRDQTPSRNVAEMITHRRDDWRIGGTKSIPKWTLAKHDGTERRVVSSYGDASDVVETRATISGDVKQRYIDPETGSAVIEAVGHRQKQYVSRCAVTKRDVAARFATAPASDPLVNSDRISHC